MDAIKEYLRAVDKLEHGEINLGEYEELCKPLRDVRENAHGKMSDYIRGYQAGYHAGARRAKSKYPEPSEPPEPFDISQLQVSSWFGEADGYADGVLVYDRWFCGACGAYFEEWEDEPTWNFCPLCGEPMTDKGREIRYGKKKER